MVSLVNFPGNWETLEDAICDVEPDVKGVVGGISLDLVITQCKCHVRWLKVSFVVDSMMLKFLMMTSTIF